MLSQFGEVDRKSGGKFYDRYIYIYISYKLFKSDYLSLTDDIVVVDLH